MIEIVDASKYSNNIIWRNEFDINCIVHIDINNEFKIITQVYVTVLFITQSLALHTSQKINFVTYKRYFKL